MPFARVCLAFAKEEVEMPKVELMALMFQERIKLAHSLKKMDDNIPNLPAIRQNEKNEKLFFEYLSYYEIESLKEGIKFLLE
jgi:hypothetical protein